MLTLKLTQEFKGFLKGLTLSVQGMTEHIGYFSEYRSIWPDLYRATGRTAQGVLIKSLRSSQQSLAYGDAEHAYRQYYLEAKANWNRTFGDHTFGALLEYYMKDEKDSQWGAIDDLGISSIPKRHQNLSGRISYDYKTVILLTRILVIQVLPSLKKANDSVSFLPLLSDGFLPLITGGLRNCLGSHF